MSIKVKNLYKIISGQKILDNISFDKKGVIGLLGPNGAGKSSLIKILTTFEKETTGEVFINDIKVSSNQNKIKNIVGYLPEHNPLYLDLYVQEYLEYIADIRNIDKSNVNDIINKTGLCLEKNKRIKMLSKGYRQRVGLAQAMIHNPQVLILDEPTTGLDPNQILEIRNLIKNFGENKTVLISTHIMQEVEAICDSVLIMNKGKLLKEGSLDKIKSEFGSVEQAFYKLTNF